VGSTEAASALPERESSVARARVAAEAASNIVAQR
jgi:hypothetical protein